MGAGQYGNGNNFMHHQNPQSSQQPLMPHKTLQMQQPMQPMMQQQQRPEEDSVWRCPSDPQQDALAALRKWQRDSGTGVWGDPKENNGKSLCKIFEFIFLKFQARISNVGSSIWRMKTKTHFDRRNRPLLTITTNLHPLKSHLIVALISLRLKRADGEIFHKFCQLISIRVEELSKIFSRVEVKL